MRIFKCLRWWRRPKGFFVHFWFTLNLESMTMQVNLAWSLPTTRTNGQPLATHEIASVTVLRNGQNLALIPATAGTNYSDTTPLVGDNTYAVLVNTTDGLVSATSNMATVSIAPVAASAVTDLTASLIA